MARIICYQFIIMFVIIFESLDKNEIKIPPLLLPISPELLTKQTSHLQELAHHHFRDHLSPFIRREHLELATPKHKMMPDYPIFIYCNFKQYINNLICTLKPFDESAALKRSYLLKNSVVVVNSKDYSQRIVKQLEIEKLDKLIRGDKSALVGGKEIKLLTKQLMDEQVVYHRKWSELVLEKWSKFESANFCVYVLI